MNEVTRILSEMDSGDPLTASRLLPLVYDELRKLATARMAREKPGQTIQPTMLVHEAYLRLVKVDQNQGWNGRGHFFAAAAEAMRRILIENARRKARLKRGGTLKRVAMDTMDQLPLPTPDDELVALDESLNRLRAEDAVAARVVELRQFAGMGHQQVADTLKISVYQARQKWTYARAWLRDALSE